MAGGVGVGAVQLTTVEIYNIASKTWRTSGTAAVNTYAFLLEQVDTGDFYALHGNLVYQYNAGAEVFDAVSYTHLTLPTIYSV